MRKYLSHGSGLSALAAVCLLVSCSGKGWSTSELSTIRDASPVMPVLTVSDSAGTEFLRRKALPLSRRMIAGEDYAALSAKMLATVKDPSQDGVGIAGPQVGISRRIVSVQRFDKAGEPFETYPNIEICARRGENVPGMEGCLSVPDRMGNVARSRDIDIRYTSPKTLKDTAERVEGFTAVIFQHECDHLDGILYTDRIWSDSTMWFRSGKPVQEAFADVFYLVSTNILSERDKNGEKVYRAALTDEQKAVLGQEIAYVSKNVFSDSLNFFSPFYHQYTMESTELPKENFAELSKTVGTEAYEAFSYYMDNLNGGRPVILAGFSQGAMMVKEILRRMTEGQYSKLAAAYVLGYGLNADDIRQPHIRPAQGAADKGVTISYNTVESPSCIWDLVHDGSIYCINPVNWRTDAEPAAFGYRGQSLTAQVDTTANVLVVKGFKGRTMPFAEPWPKGCLHHYEFLFFADQLRENAKRRVY